MRGYRPALRALNVYTTLLTAQSSQFMRNLGHLIDAREGFTGLFVLYIFFNLIYCTEIHQVRKIHS